MENKKIVIVGNIEDIKNIDNIVNTYNTNNIDNDISSLSIKNDKKKKANTINKMPTPCPSIINEYIVRLDSADTNNNCYIIISVTTAMSHTLSEIVAPHNYEKLSQAVKNGPNVYPGAYCICKKSHDDDSYTRTKLGMYVYQPIQQDDDIVLNYGDIIDRHIQAGDMIMYKSKFREVKLYAIKEVIDTTKI